MADLRDYIAVTASYWGFTLTDGALRMLVLLHFHGLGYSPLDLATLFLLYEAMGVITNFFGGWIGARFGLNVTLFTGLSVQIIALLALAVMLEEWVMPLSILSVMLAQALSGVAKDLTKMSSKSAVKFVVNETSHSSNPLYRWVALLTGSKNALKGVGFFLGGVLLQIFGAVHSLFVMAAALVVVLLISVVAIRKDLGKTKKIIKTKDLFSKSREINWLSFARVFLFASRDVWFVVGLPIFLYAQMTWSFDQVGAFMAVWVIGYGIVQAFAPRLTRRVHNSHQGAIAARNWVGFLFLTMVGLAYALYEGQQLPFRSEYILLGGLLLFGVVFAINSSLHSYLIVAYADEDDVALSVGFYYMANAVGRLIGTLLSGLTFQYGGLVLCLVVSAAMVLVSFLGMVPLTGKPKEKTL